MEYPGFTHYEKMSEEQKNIIHTYRDDTKELCIILKQRIEEAMKYDYFGRLADTNKDREVPIVHGCNKWMIAIVNIYYEMLQELMKYASQADQDEYYKWRVESGAKRYALL